MTKRLITEADLRHGSIADPFVIDRDTVVTPAALDLLFARGVRVIFARDGSSAAPMTGAAGSPIPSGSPSGDGPIGRPPTACSCKTARESAASDPSERPPQESRTRSSGAVGSPIDSKPSASEEDWVATFRRGRTRRFDPTPFRAGRSEASPAQTGVERRRSFLITATGNGRTSAFVAAIERAGYRVVEFSRRDAAGGAHLVARVEGESHAGSSDLAIESLERSIPEFEVRVHSSL